MITFNEGENLGRHMAEFDKIFRIFALQGYRLKKINLSEMSPEFIKMMGAHASHGHQTHYYILDRTFLFTDPEPVKTGYDLSMERFKEEMKI